MATAGAAWALACAGARAQGTHGAIRLVLGFSAGGAADRVARVLGPELARLVGRGAIVENIPGANGARAITRVAVSEPDGDTLLFATSAIAHPDHAAAMESLRPVILTSTTPIVLVVRASLPVRDARQFGRYLVAHPGTTYGSAGIGNPTHLCAAELVERLNARATHIPYSGTTPALADLLGGHIDFLMLGANPALAQQGGVRMIAVSTRARSRLAAFASLPTIGESMAPGFDFSLWQAVYAPARVSASTVTTLHAQFREILALGAVQSALADVGSEVGSGTTEDAERVYRAEVVRFRAAVSR
ncbi:MAG: tripartite tricarboxylate transporter substrate binding protein [Betaproteobacteria bacterium]